MYLQTRLPDGDTAAMRRCIIIILIDVVKAVEIIMSAAVGEYVL
jgi:hypothetical protein